MSDTVRWRVIVGSLCVLLALLMQVPYFLHRVDPRYKGLPVYLNSDVTVYQARVQESLSGRPEMAAEAFVGHPGLIGTQFALTEQMHGIVFRFTGLRAPEVLTIMDSVMPPVVFLLVVLFFRLAGFSRYAALSAACVFSVVELYSLNRPIHMRASFALMLLALCGMTFSVRQAKIRTSAAFVSAIFGGAVLGLLVGVYFWSWSFAWLYWGIFLLWECTERFVSMIRASPSHASRLRQAVSAVGRFFWHLRPRKPTLHFERWHLLLIAGCVGVVTAFPFVVRIAAILSHPLHDVGVFRSGIHLSHMPESVPYFIIFATMAVCALAASFRDPDELRPYRPAAVLIVTAFLYGNQQIVHGIVFNFVSHAIFSLAIAALSSVLLAVFLKKKILVVGAVAACVYLAAIAYDGRYVVKQWTVKDSDFAMQHLADALPILDGMQRVRILTDPYTSEFIAGYTRHDVVFSVYLKNVLMTNEELAMRLCLTLSPLSPAKRDIPRRHPLIFPDASAAFGPEVREEEERIVEEGCALMDADIPAALQAHEVGFVFWNSEREPNWNLRRLGVTFTEVAHGDGWVFYKINF